MGGSVSGLQAARYGNRTRHARRIALWLTRRDGWGEPVSTKRRVVTTLLWAVVALALATWAVWWLSDVLASGEFHRRGRLVTRIDNPFRFWRHVTMLAGSAVLFGGLAVVLVWAAFGLPDEDRRIDRLLRSRSRTREKARSASLLDEHSGQLEGDGLAGGAELLDGEVEAGGERVDDALDQNLRGRGPRRDPDR